MGFLASSARDKALGLFSIRSCCARFRPNATLFCRTPARVQNLAFSAKSAPLLCHRQSHRCCPNGQYKRAHKFCSTCVMIVLSRKSKFKTRYVQRPQMNVAKKTTAARARRIGHSHTHKKEFLLSFPFPAPLSLSLSLLFILLHLSPSISIFLKHGHESNQSVSHHALFLRVTH